MRRTAFPAARLWSTAALAMLLSLSVACSTASPRADAAEPEREQTKSAHVTEVDAPIYCLDPVHTRVMLGVEHAGFSKAIGTVSGSTGELRFDPDAWPQAQITVSIPIERLDFGDEKWNKAVLAGNLLDAARYPTANFVSERIETTGENRATVHGTLRLHGNAQPVALEVAMNAIKRHPLPPFRRTVGFSARGTLSRKAFGIDAWPSVIGDEVELRIEAEATRGRCDEKPPEHAPNEDAPVPADPAS